MARDFSKNVSNYMSLGINTIVPVLAGSSQISIHAFVTVDSFTSSVSLCNDILSFFFGQGSLACALLFDTSSGNNRLRAGGRSGTGDIFLGAISPTNLSTGVQYSLGCVFDYAGDRIRLFVDGVQTTNATVLFANATLTQTTGTNITHDGIGAGFFGSAPVNTSRQMDGRISELSIFGSDIGLAGFQMLSDGYAADMIGPAPSFYFPLLGDDSPERDHYGGTSGTITGSIPQADHPNIIYPVSPKIIIPSTVSTSFKNYWLRHAKSLIGGGIK